MKYAIRYINTFKYYSEIDEVIFDYKEEGNLIEVVTKLLSNENQKATIDLSHLNEIENAVSALNELKQEHENIMAQIDFYKQRDYIELLKDNQIPFMFSNFAKDFSTVAAMRLAGAEEVYIVEDLGFHMLDFENLRKGGLRIRVIPNIAQCPPATQYYLPEITKFWIRPEDIEVYKNNVDVCELYPMGEQISVVYEIYKKEQWLGNLSDIILDFNDNIPNTGIPPHFGSCRLNCKKQCIYKTCNICTEISQLAPKFKDSGLEVIKKRKKKKIDVDIKQQKINELKERGKDLINELEINEEDL